MAGSKQPKRVSWAPDLSLRQIRLFLSEDAPSQSRFGAEDHLQAKASWLVHANGIGADDSLPPGFETPAAANRFEVDISDIPTVKWSCPLRFVLNPEWLVVVGEESEEVTKQNQRLRGVLEAFYPCPSSIPPDPSVSSEVEATYDDDLDAPLIPITAIEDEDTPEQPDIVASVDTAIQSETVDVTGKQPDERILAISPNIRSHQESLKTNSDPPIPNLLPNGRPIVGLIPSAEPDVMAAASAAFTAIMRSSEKGSMIDRDLLIKILSDPAMIQKLMSENGMPKQTLPPISLLSAPPLPPSQINVSSIPPSPPMHSFSPANVVRPPNMQASPAMKFNALNPPPVAPQFKGINYYKSLIQQHGEDRQDLPSSNPLNFDNHHRDYANNLLGVNGIEMMAHDSKQRDTRPKVSKPCIYFNTRKGCRKGSSCPFQHDAACAPQIELQKRSKRIKLDNGNAGKF